DWSSDVCSSDLPTTRGSPRTPPPTRPSRRVVSAANDAGVRYRAPKPRVSFVGHASELVDLGLDGRGPGRAGLRGKKGGRARRGFAGVLAPGCVLGGAALGGE